MLLLALHGFAKYDVDNACIHSCRVLQASEHSAPDVFLVVYLEDGSRNAQGTDYSVEGTCKAPSTSSKATNKKKLDRQEASSDSPSSSACHYVGTLCYPPGDKGSETV